MHRTSLSSCASTPAAVVAALVCSLQISSALAQQSAAPVSSTQPATPTPAAPTQPAPPRDIPTPDQLEPGVNTTPSAAAAPRATVPAAPTTPTPPAGTAPRKAAAATAAEHKGPDRLQLDATEITGNRELPKVLYIVPWKRSDLGDLTGRPVNSLLDEVLQPLDRDVFQRENRYYNGLQPPAAAPKGGTAQGGESKP
jgi:hypothetical protein